jgi:hypothetical protein
MVRAVNVPRNVDVNTNLSITAYPEAGIADPSAPTVAELGAGVEVVYEFPPDGWNESSSQETIQDPRLSLADVPEAPGKSTTSLEPTYFYGDPELELDPLLVKDARIFIVVRDTVDVTDDFAAAQKVDVYSVIVGKPRKNRATDGKQTKTTKLFVQQTWTDVAVVA